MDLQEIFDTYLSDEESEVSFEELSDCASTSTEQDEAYIVAWCGWQVV